LAALDPVRLLREIREAQRVLAQLEVGVAHAETARSTQELSGFVASLATVWRDGEVRPTHRKRTSGPRSYRTRVDPFESVWPRVQLVAQRAARCDGQDAVPAAARRDADAIRPWATPDSAAPGQGVAIARRLVLGAGDEGEVLAAVAKAEPVT